MVRKLFLTLSLITLIFWLGSCDQRDKTIFEVEVTDLEEVPLTLDTLRANELSILFFLSPECPLCQNYTVTMKRFTKKYQEEGIKFYGIFPGKEYSPREIKKYLIRYELGFEVFMDPVFALTELLEATITPEVFVLNGEGEVLYQGAFDNWAIDLGTKRNNITEHYLRDALDNALAGMIIDPKKTEPVGCFIQ